MIKNTLPPPPDKTKSDYFWLKKPLERVIHYNSYFGKIIRGKTVVDVGCSWGSETLFLGCYWHPKRIIGVDNYGCDGGVPENQSRFLENIKKTGNKCVEVMQADAFDIPLKKGSIDIIIASQALHHFFDCSQDFRQIRDDDVKCMAKSLKHWDELLAPDGIVLVRDTYRHCFKRYLGEAFPRFRTQVKYNEKQEPEGWIRLMEAAGFKLDELRPYVPYTLRHFTPIVSTRLFNPLVTTFYCMRFSKIQGI
ncbi:MAG TPA: hypothetical protein DET40_00825 [Lentisphaeria bacterium]|nr:MAG: hypothetical protein A2X45_06350 [Lentisphaerae bacterium GWF2_50_93]HCE42075.1 hypothetical protein [Lentisphaeria bacterium]